MSGGCGKIKEEELSAYVDGVLDGNTLRTIMSHLLTCDPCTRLVADFREQQAMLHNLRLQLIEPHSQFWANAHRAAQLSSPKAAVHAPVFNLRLNFSQLAGFALAAAVGAVVASQVQLSSLHTVNVAPAQSGPSLDVNTLVRAHADYAAQQPLADNAHITMVMSDVASQPNPVVVTPATDDVAVNSVMNAPSPSD